MGCEQNPDTLKSFQIDSNNSQIEKAIKMDVLRGLKVLN